jgi:hypothetical protein
LCHFLQVSGGARREQSFYAAAHSYLQRSQVDGSARREQRFYAAAHALPVEYFRASFPTCKEAK